MTDSTTKLTITAVERFLVDVPLEPVAERNMARTQPEWSISEICKVTTDAGLVGIGETLVNYSWANVTEATVARVIGGNPFELMWDDALGAGLQIALFDVAGKAAGAPVHRLLGNKVRDWCPVAWWSVDMPPEDMAAEASRAVELGYTAHKQKARPYFDVVEQVEAVSSVVPKHFRVELDFNEMLLNAGSALPLLKELDTFANVALYESPIPQADVEGNLRLRSQTCTPTALHVGVPPLATAIQHDMCDGFVVGGGVSSVLRQAAILSAFNKQFFLQIVGTGITASFALHIGAVATHASWPAVSCFNMYSHQLIAAPIQVEGGYSRVPEGPGLGVELDTAALEGFRTDDLTKPVPRALYVLVRPDRTQTWYPAPVPMQPNPYWDDFIAGNQPIGDRGMRLETVPDDGSEAWADLHRRVQQGPVHCNRGDSATQRFVKERL
jgi:L-alanine-DL-glutamate epimerase-like enolase superfamily enzyme